MCVLLSVLCVHRQALAYHKPEASKSVEPKFCNLQAALPDLKNDLKILKPQKLSK